MWLIFAICSAVFAGLTSILAKCGLQEVDSTVATAFRTVVAMVFAWIIVLISGSYAQIDSIDADTWIFLILSGLATGASWLCYFKALQLGDVNKVVPVDKSSTVMAIMLAIIFLGETLSIPGIFGVVLILVGTILMIEKKDVKGMESKGSSWLLFAIGSAVFAALTSILGKIGMEGIDSNLGTAIRTIVVLGMSWIMIYVSHKQSKIHGIKRRDMAFIILSGLATGASWMFFFGALQMGPASVIIPIDKLSILVTIAFSYIVFREKLTKKSAIGLAGVVTGTLLLLLR
ncbi:MAG: EamA family transporter [Candidatus Methanomethylophilaceae archaeon]|nr:EamA family transporter [Candidatus Methanomethylophilaceae archaeon]MBR6214646.1 EamA family transporter [Candidatus Methanomethylophilaceae archaeon]